MAIADGSASASAATRPRCITRTWSQAVCNHVDACQRGGRLDRRTSQSNNILFHLRHKQAWSIFDDYMKTERLTPETNAHLEETKDFQDTLEIVEELRRERAHSDSKHKLWMMELRKVTELEAQIVELEAKIRRIKKSHEETERDEIEAMREAIKEAHDALFRLVALGSLELPHRRDAALAQGEKAISKLAPFLP